MTVTTDEGQTEVVAPARPKKTRARPGYAQVKCSHCAGTGHEPGAEIPRSWLPYYERLQELGQVRRERQFLRGKYGEELRSEVYAEIRPAVEEAESIGMTQEDCADALGIGRMALYNIMTGKVGGQGADVHAEKVAARLNAVVPEGHAVRRQAGRRPASSRPRADQKWTDEEVEILKNVALTDQECADQLGRSRKGVQMKRDRLGVRGGE